MRYDDSNQEPLPRALLRRSVDALPGASSGTPNVGGQPVNTEFLNKIFTDAGIPPIGAPPPNVAPAAAPPMAPSNVGPTMPPPAPIGNTGFAPTDNRPAPVVNPPIQSTEPPPGNAPPATRYDGPPPPPWVSRYNGPADMRRPLARSLLSRVKRKNTRPVPWGRPQQ